MNKALSLIEIKSHRTGATLFSGRFASLRLCVEAAVKSEIDLGGADLSGADLSDATLRGADLRDADLRDTDLRDTDLRGANLSRAYLRDAYLSNADLRDADLREADLRGAYLIDADLSGADLRRADLSDADLRDADLGGAYLSDADFSRAIPIILDIDAAILAAIDSGGKLTMGNWHTCGTTHCRAGWAITLAGEAGAGLECEVGPSAAGALIYAASRPGKPVPEFYASDDDAMASIRADAAAEVAKITPPTSST